MTRSIGMTYEAPEMSVVTLMLEQCIASSVKLLDMDENKIYDESF